MLPKTVHIAPKNTIKAVSDYFRQISAVPSKLGSWLGFVTWRSKLMLIGQNVETDQTLLYGPESKRKKIKTQTEQKPTRSEQPEESGKTISKNAIMCQKFAR